MFDGIKLRIKDEVTNAALLKNHLLDFTAIHKETGEEPTPEDREQNIKFNYKYAEYKGLKIKVHDSGLVLINGSLHKFFNDGAHNFNQYSIDDVKTTLKRLYDELNINANDAEVQNLEFGINLVTTYNPSYIIANLRNHKNRAFYMMQEGDGKTTVANNAQYGLKVYNKGLQYAKYTSDSILRFEVKCVKMECIRPGRIYLSDLVTPAIIDRCSTMLKQAFTDLVIKEPVNEDKLTTKEKELYLKATNAAYWEDKENTLSRFKKHRDKQKYNDLLLTHSLDRIKAKTYVILEETLSRITQFKPETRNVLTDSENSFAQRSDTLYKLSKRCTPKQPPRKCLSCGQDISNQRAGSLYCSEKIYGKEAKRCRNMNSNRRRDYNKKVHYARYDDGVLFDVNPYFKNPGIIDLKLN